MLKFYYFVVCKGNYHDAPCSIPEIIMEEHRSIEQMVKELKEVNPNFYYHIWEVPKGTGPHPEKPYYFPIYTIWLRKGKYNDILTA